jgi:hypothetical protein
MISPLSFEVLEDVMELPQDVRDQELAGAAVEDIGPLIEAVYSNYNDPFRSLRMLLPSLETRELDHVLKLSSLEQSQQDLTVVGRSVEFFRSPQTDDQFDSRSWQAFRMRMQDAAKKAGLSLKFAQGLVATLDDMANNAADHCENPRTAIVGYKWTAGSFEYIVADAGIGVLKSLHTCSEYSFVSDSGEALEIAIQSGESRYGKGSGHGLGFDHLVLNIANRNSRLRFRSGDYSLTLDGLTQPTEKIIRPCSDLQGFLISVHSFLPK